MPFFCCLLDSSSLELCVCAADGYDPLDPNGNITITYDIQTWTTRGYVVSLMLVLSHNAKINPCSLAPLNFLFEQNSPPHLYNQTPQLLLCCY